jgi:uncharacterized protein YqeY
MTLRPQLRAALTKAMKARDTAAVAALRSALAAVDNAEAVDPGAAGLAVSSGEGPVAKSAAGLGAADVPRRELSDDDEAAIVRAEIGERRAAADDYERLGRAEEAARLRAEADVLAAVLVGG